MKTERFVAAIGKQADSDIVVELLKECGISNRVHIKTGETDVYLNNEKEGVSLLFESERYIHAKHGVNLLTDAPVLTAIFLYGQGDDEFSEYQGDLPGGLSFADNQKTAIEKLGQSTKFNPDRGSEFWDFANNVRFFVRYKEGNRSIARVQFGILWR